VAVESAALVILAAGLLVFRTFRERYLLIWILGWLAYFVSNWTIHHPGVDSGSHYAVAVSQSQFVLALCLFSAAVFVYSNARKVLVPLLALAPLSLLAGWAGASRTFYWIGALFLSFGFLYYGTQFVLNKSSSAARQLLAASIIYLPLLFLLIVFPRG